MIIRLPENVSGVHLSIDTGLALLDPSAIQKQSHSADRSWPILFPDCQSISLLPVA
jgi:hypothetical protein